MVSRHMSKYRRHSLVIEGGADCSVVSFVKLLSKGLGVDCPDNIQDILDLKVSYDETTTAATFRDRYLISEVASKYPFKVPGVDRAARALAKFDETEVQCSLTNRSIRASSSSLCKNRLDWQTVIQTARAKIDRLLGPFSWDQAEVHFAFGPGASTSHKRVASDALYKIGQKPDVTQDCALLAWCAIYRIPRWFEILTGSLPSASWRDDIQRFPPEEIFTIIPGNKVVTVPKNAKIDRVIAIEPDMNMFVQKGLGKLLRGRLRRVGIDLNTQRKNQMLARKGSLYGNLASVDFSSASDTISNEVVELLLPGDWLLALKQCRSPVGVLPDGRVVQYQKFSSMGNGYTFELESLIFWAIARAVTDLCTPRRLGRGIVMVYGDDLIVQSVLQEPMSWAFERAGFTLNLKKSFFTGPFRESCGKHYFNGVDVSPFYVRKELRSIWSVYSPANRLRKWARMHWGLDARCKEAYDFLVGLLPRWSHRLIPDGIGDVGLVADFDESSPSLCRKARDRGIVVWSASGFLPKVNRRHEPGGYNTLVKWHLLRKEIALEESVSVVQRVDDGVVARHTFRAQQWPSYGPWI